MSFLYFISSIQSFNTLSKTIIVINKHLFAHMKIENNIFMVETTGVRGPSLARLAMVLVLLSIGNTPAPLATSGEPSTWFPLG